MKKESVKLFLHNWVLNNRADKKANKYQACFSKLNLTKGKTPQTSIHIFFLNQRGSLIMFKFLNEKSLKDCCSFLKNHWKFFVKDICQQIFQNL
jgi:hypothetical protein